MISAAGYGRRSPITIACETNLDVLRSFSRFCGRDVLPARGDDDVLLAVGDRDEAVVVDRRDVARAQPAVLAQHLGGRLGLLEVAGEDGLAPDQQLAVLGDTQLEAGQRGADGAEAVAVGAVRRRRRRALREAVALEDPDRQSRRRTRRSPSRAAHRPRSASGADRPAAPSPSRRRAGRRAGAGGRARAGAACPAPRSALSSRPTRAPTRRACVRTPGRVRRTPRRRRCAPSRRRAARSEGSIGRTSGIARATSSGSGRKAIVIADVRAGEVHQPAEVVRERQVQEHHVAGLGVRTASRRRPRPSRSSCGAGSCSPWAAPSSRRCR